MKRAMTALPAAPLRGVHHLALCTDDMKKTVDFYVGVLGLPLVHAMKVPAGLPSIAVGLFGLAAALFGRRAKRRNSARQGLAADLAGRRYLLWTQRPKDSDKHQTDISIAPMDTPRWSITLRSTSWASSIEISRPVSDA